MRQRADVFSPENKWLKREWHGLCTRLNGHLDSPRALFPAPGAAARGHSAPCCGAGRMWGRRLRWFMNFPGTLFLFWNGGKLGCSFVGADKMKQTKRAVLIFSKYCWNYRGNPCLCPLRCSGEGRFGSRFCCEINNSELLCIEFQWVSEQFRFVKAALLGDFSASVFVESTSAALPSCMQE